MKVTLSRRSSRSPRPIQWRARLWPLSLLEERVQPSTFIVTNTSDAGAGSLRDAIDKANKATGADVVDLTSLTGTISLLSILPTVTDTTTINGPGANKLTVQLDPGAPASRLLVLGGSVNISGLTLTGGRPTDDGGAMYVYGQTTLSGCVITGNIAARGGAVFTFDTSMLTVNNCVIAGNTSTGVGGAFFQAFDSTLVLRNSLVSNNSAGANSFGGGGGAAYFGFNGRLDVSNCTISGNNTTGAGGGLYMYGGANAPAENSWVVTQSTISNNTSAGDGGGIAFWSDAPDSLVVQDCTISGNTAATSGGGISTPASYSGLLTLRSTIVAGNSAPSAQDVSTANVVVATNSAFSDATGFTITPPSATNQFDVFANLKLGPLQNNGGPTLPDGNTLNSQLPLAGSPLIDAGANVLNKGLDTRGYPRTTGAGLVDIGAAEFGTEALAGTVPVFNSYVSNGKASFTIQVTYTDDTAVKLSTIDNSDLAITGPSVINVIGVTVDQIVDGPKLVATYTISPTDNSWDPADIGQYIVNVVAGQVTDTSSNPISAGIVGTFAAVPAPQVFAVTTNADSGAGSLRDAITKANASTGTHDTITFAIGSGSITLTPTKALPTITDEVTIDGYTQPGYVSTPLIQLVGSSAGANTDGLHVNAGNTVIRGLNIRSFTRTGIMLETGDGNTVQNCYIGTNVAGTAAAGNGYRGISIRDSDNNLIGGATTQTRNVISGNTDHGVCVLASFNNVFQNNYMGTNAAGSVGVANSINGIFIGRGSAYNTLTGNLLSGNFNHGIQMYDPGTSHNRVQGNKIGTNAAGTTAIKNGGQGPSSNSYGNGLDIAFGTSDNLFGTNGDGVYDAAEGNLISGNHDTGIVLFAGGTDRNVVAGNKIGTNNAGTGAIPNTGDGIRIDAGSANNFIGTNGDGSPGDNIEGNVLSGNSGYGVQIVGAGTNNNRVAGNIVGLNAAGTGKLANNFEGLVLHFGASNNIIGTNGDGVSDALERNVISGNASYGITIARVGTVNNVVAGNLVGTDITGNVGIGNGRAGVWIFIGATNTLVGSNADGVSDNLERNVISGNGTVAAFPGVQIENQSADSVSDNIVAGNYIGTNAAGTAPIPNATFGVEIRDISGGGAVFNNTIGGVLPAQRNLISGNSLSGVSISGVMAHDNIIIGNFIGTTADGKSALPNNNSGVSISASANNRVGTNGDGSNDLAEGNLISGNVLDGIRLLSGTSGTTVAGNRIGTDVSGLMLGNGLAGVDILDGVTGTTVGGPTSVSDNTIAFNADAGVAIVGAGANGNLISRNSIFGNTGLGIDLGDDGITPNDPLDVDVGPNGLLNFPTLTASTNGASTTVSGTYSGAASTSVTLSFYASASGGAQGTRYLGSTMVTTDGSGNATFTNVVIAGASAAGEFITATATDAANSTSEFSNAVQNPLSSAKVANVIVNSNAAQRSRVTTLEVDFNQTVSFTGGNANAAAAFTLLRQSDSMAVTLSAAVDNTGPTTKVTLTFTGGAVNNISLADGRYTLGVVAAQVNGGNFDGNGDGTPGDNYVRVGTPANGLFRLFGDADGNGLVDGLDFGAFRTAFNTNSAIFDFDGSGIVDGTDFGQFRQRFGVSI